MHEIDIVVAWVDGHDTKLKKTPSVYDRARYFGCY